MSLKGKLVHVEVTDVGKVETTTKTRSARNRRSVLWVLADGMGGYNAGEVASGIAVKTIIDLVTEACKRPEKRNEIEAGTGYMRQTIVLRDAIHRANKVINQTAQSQPQCEGMGTTLVASLFYDNRVSIAHVGDSRMYRLRGNRFEQITMDHSLLQELVDRGFYSQEEAQRSTNRNYVTRALGVEANVEVEVQEVEVQKGDYFLMCSDGLPDMVEDEDIHLTISTFSNDVRTVGEQLIKLTNDNGGRDNVSVILVRVADSFPAEAGILGKFRGLFGSLETRGNCLTAMVTLGNWDDYHGTLDSQLGRPDLGGIQHDQGALYRRPIAGQRHPHRQRGRQRSSLAAHQHPQRFVPRGSEQHQRHLRQRQAHQEARAAAW